MSEDINKNKENIAELDKRMSSHEAMCEERWKTCFQHLESLDNGIGRLESILIGFAGGALVATIGVIVAILWA